MLRDRLALALILILPLMQLTLMGQSLAFIVLDLPVVVQDFDNSPASRELIETLRAPAPDGRQQACADLVAIETHGRGGLSRLFLGSVADKVLRGSTLPVLLQRPIE